MKRSRRKAASSSSVSRADTGGTSPGRMSLFRWFVVFCWILSIVLGAVVGLAFTSVSPLTTRVRELEHWRISMPSVVYDRDGNVIHEFSVQRRILVERYEDIPPLLRGAIIAVEDDDFFIHPGINPLSILRAAIQNLRAGRIVQGGSTITQQLAKMAFLTPERTLDRKIKEFFLALQIEKHFSKQEIFLHYYNNVYLGHGVYGFEAAARFYFGKPARDLLPEEAALLAGLVRAPARYSPYLAPAKALARRNYCLRRMLKEKVIPPEVYQKAVQQPIRVVHHREKPIFAPYFIEEIRRYVEKKYGYDALYHQGLRIYTTLDQTAQTIAERALRNGLYLLARRQPWNGPLRNVLQDAKAPVDLETITLPEWPDRIPLGTRWPVLITEVQRTQVRYRIGGYHGTWTLRDIRSVLHTRDLRRVLHPGDVVMAKIIDVDLKHARARAEIENVPVVEGAFVALDALTGEVRAMVGGFDFRRSQFNRVTQAYRQVGSAFKPFVWTAAIESGMSLSTPIEDAPFSYEDPRTHVIWEPGNFDNKFLGTLTLRRALEFSRNTVAARLITHVGIDRVIDVARRAGITSPIPPYPSIALGTMSLTPLEITAAYAVFANGGMRVRPYWIRRIEDRFGRPLEVHTPDLEPALDPATAFIITWALRGVTQRGTAAHLARSLPFDVAGKTGTTDEFTNAWFIGFTTELVAGVWVGFDEPKRLGKNETGGHAALPIWVDFMKTYYTERPAPPGFERPATVVMLPVDYYTGLRASPECPRIILEAFRPGTEPLEYCSVYKHQPFLESATVTGH